MTNLEAAFPETVFVYMTMPLTTASDWENGLRNGFNERVRDWTRQTGRVLFDLADIEAHDSKGELCSFSHRNKTRAKLAESYSNDGGHLNETGRQLVAQGFYALALALQEKKRALVNAAK
jgi:lysophospholipase L1-like esterase